MFQPNLPIKSSVCYNCLILSLVFDVTSCSQLHVFHISMRVFFSHPQHIVVSAVFMLVLRRFPSFFDVFSDFDVLEGQMAVSKDL